MQRIPDRFQNRFRLLQDFEVPKSQFANALAGDRLSTNFIAAPSFIRIVLSAIQLNRKFRVVAVEIEYKAT